jgi:hypothetical protein
MSKVECRFCVEIHAPRGLRGIEPHLARCGLALEAWKSGYNDKVILRALPDSELAWEMDSSDSALMFASGCISNDLRTADAQLRKLSTALRMARFPHRILLDDAAGNLHVSIEHAWPPSEL